MEPKTKKVEEEKTENKKKLKNANGYAQKYR